MQDKVIKAYKGFNKEEWLPVVGYEGLYEISSIGRVKSCDRIIRSGRSYGLHKQKGIILTQIYDKDGYMVVSLSKNGKRKPERVHRLVARAFLDNPNRLPVVNHKNMDKSDNRVGNLEWCTVYYNNHYGKGYKDRMKDSRVAVIQSDVNGCIIMKHDSLSSAAKYVRGNRNTISKHCRNSSNKVLYGSIWRFA